MRQQTYQQFSDAFVVMLHEASGNQKHVLYAKEPSRSDLGGSTLALDRVSWMCSLFMIDFLCRLIAHQDSSANRHSLHTSRGRRITRVHQEGSLQLSASSGQRLLAGGPSGPLTLSLEAGSRSGWSCPDSPRSADQRLSGLGLNSDPASKGRAPKLTQIRRLGAETRADPR